MTKIRPILFKLLPKKTMLAAAFAAPLFFFPASTTHATVTITPMIVVIEGRERFADVNLINTTGKANSYEVGWVFNEMVEGTGTYKSIEKSTTDFDLSKNVMFTPRRVTLPPNELQKIRLALRLKGEPPAPGDYRAHLEIKQFRPPEPEVPLDKTDGQPKMQVGVNVNVGFSIPVVYRVGESNVRPVIGGVTTEVNPKTGMIEVIIPVTRTDGPYGVLGQLQVLYNDNQVGLVRNANIFAEIKSRTFRIPLTESKLSGGKLRIVYKHYKSSNDEVYAEKTINIAP